MRIKKERERERKKNIDERRIINEYVN